LKRKRKQKGKKKTNFLSKLKNPIYLDWLGFLGCGPWIRV
jgi:hypothetical protein